MKYNQTEFAFFIRNLLMSHTRPRKPFQMYSLKLPKFREREKHPNCLYKKLVNLNRKKINSEFNCFIQKYQIVYYYFKKKH